MCSRVRGPVRGASPFRPGSGHTHRGRVADRSPSVVRRPRAWCGPRCDDATSPSCRPDSAPRSAPPRCLDPDRAPEARTAGRRRAVPRCGARANTHRRRSLGRTSRQYPRPRNTGADKVDLPSTTEGAGMQRNTELERIAEIFIGDWALTITNQWWLDDPTTPPAGTPPGEGPAG